MIHMGFALWILFVCGWVVGVKVLYKCVWRAVLKRNNNNNNMAEVARTRSYYPRMLGASSGNSSSSERSRARRRRRIELRRNSGNQANADGSQVLPDDGGSDSNERSEAEGSSVIGIPVPASCFSWVPGSGGFVMRGSIPRLPLPALARQLLMPAMRKAQAPVVGAVAVAGRQRQMEDAVAIRTNLCSPLINRARPVHFFGVYDGHGGPHHALICKEKMHAILKEELTGVQVGDTPMARPPPGIITDETVLQETWRILISRVFSRTEMVGQHTCICGTEDFQCCCESGDVSFSGTTAVAMVLTEKHIVVGNCGDSRAVLYRRRGRVVPLSFDHKPERSDEKARIEASGGRVVYIDTPRVQGILAMSRAIGDAYLKPYVISDPEVTFTRRDDDDEFIILATDGMWDVIPTDMAGRVTRECLREPPAAPDQGSRGRPRFPSRSASAASLLTRLALARRSADNISVVVVDLSRNVFSPN